MRREVTTTVQVRLHSLTNRKQRLLEREYEAFQTAVHDDPDAADLYSATEQQVSKVQRQKDPNPGTEQPVVLRNDVISIAKDTTTTLSRWWMKVPVYDPAENGGSSIWCPAIVPDKDADETLLTDENISDSELVQQDGDWYVHLVIERSVAVQDEYDDVLAVDMGARWIATTTFLSDRDTEFHGEDLRRIREHHKQLRKSIGKAKVRRGAQVIERLGDRESHQVDDRLHKIANRIVERARARDAVIVVGDLTGLRYDNDKGRYVNDKTHQMPYAKLATYLRYKARLAGRECVLVDEADTSRTCWRCGSRATSRESQGLVECGECGLADNADKNGASNIAQRAVGKDITSPLSTAGAAVARPGTRVCVTPVDSDEEPANSHFTGDVGLTLSGGSPRL